MAAGDEAGLVLGAQEAVVADALPVVEEGAHLGVVDGTRPVDGAFQHRHIHDRDDRT